MRPNLILLTDSYKVSHGGPGGDNCGQYPPRTETVYSFFESRGGAFPTTTFFGLQALILRYLVTPVTQADLDQAIPFYRNHFGQDLLNVAGWQHIIDAHQGRLPIRIKAVPEGTTVPIRNVLMTVENTDPAVPWLTNWLETLLSQVWYPTTVCTQSRAMRQDIIEALERSGTPDEIGFKLHDFGFRGSTSVESSAIGGAAHLVNFLGTDTVSALTFLSEYYDEPMAGFSIPAAEHSTITSWGRDREIEAYRNMLRQFPAGLVAVVSDSYDIFHACKEIWGQALRTEVFSREGVLIVRPDSGDPPTVVVKVLDLLGQGFGYSVNRKGFKVLDPHVRVIQGDGIDRTTVPTILKAVMGAGWSADNLAFGSGGGLLQKVDRDTCKFAFKCSAVRIGDEWRDVYKDPVTDAGKASKRGRLRLSPTLAQGTFTQPLVSVDDTPDDLLRTVFQDGIAMNIEPLSVIRARART